MKMVPDDLATRIATDIAMLCGFGPDRAPGTEANARAITEVAARMRSFGLAVETLPFETVGWRPVGASIGAGDVRVDLHPGPYSPSLEARGPLLSITNAEQLAAVEIEPGAVLLLHGGIAAEQLTPRAYPFYENPEHAAIHDDIERVRPAAVIAATGKNPAMTAALSPFPLIEDGAFATPSAYLAEGDVGPLIEAARRGAIAEVSITSERFTAHGEQVVGLLGRQETAEDGGSHPTTPAVRRVIVCAHVDTKHDTPGAIDNASGVATLLASAALLAEDPPTGAIEVHFVPFNGEDHYAAPGEMAYLAEYPPGAGIALVVNIDGAGWREGPSAFSTYGLPAEIEAVLAPLLDADPRVAAGESWMASDHAVFAMQGIAAVAVTSAQLNTIMESVAHTPADTPDLVDAGTLAATARVIADLVRAVR